MTLRTATVSSDGSLHNEALLDARVCDCCGTASAQTDEGAVVAYRNRSDDEIRDIYLTRFTNGEWTEPVAVHNDGWRIEGCPVNGPAILARGQEVVVAWFTMADGEPLVKLARSVDQGSQFDPPIRINTENSLGRVDLAWLANGDLVVSYLVDRGEQAAVRLARVVDGAVTADDDGRSTVPTTTASPPPDDEQPARPTSAATSTRLFRSMART